MFATSKYLFHERFTLLFAGLLIISPPLGVGDILNPSSICSYFYLFSFVPSICYIMCWLFNFQTTKETFTKLKKNNQSTLDNVQNARIITFVFIFLSNFGSGTCKLFKIASQNCIFISINIRQRAEHIQSP